MIVRFNEKKLNNGLFEGQRLYNSVDDLGVN